MTTEAEYVACSEVIKEIVFISQLLHHLRIDVEHPVNVHDDTIGGIFLDVALKSVVASALARMASEHCTQIMM